MADQSNAHSSAAKQVASNTARFCSSYDIYCLLKSDLETEAKLTGFSKEAMRADIFEILLVTMFNENISPERVKETVNSAFNQWMKARS